MKKVTELKFMSLLLLTCMNMFCLTFAKGDPVQATLTGNITDASNKQPVPGVIVYFNDLKKGGITDIDGNYEIHDLPETRLKIQVSCIGYNMIATTIDLSVIKTMDFVLVPSVSELSEVVVTGHSQESEKNRTPVPVTTIPSLELQQSGSTNIMETVASQAGISQVSTGPAISKPVIRGLGFNRVVVVHDGIRQEGQQWGEEHGVEIDGFSIDRVEIIKGPASLAYGSDALAGVVNLIGPPVLPLGTIRGEVISGFHTNNGLLLYSLNLGGNNNDYIWDLRWSQQAAHAYTNKYDGYVLNSGFSEHALSGIIGVNKTWGYSHLNFSSYYLEPGIVEGERDSSTGAFVQPEMMNDSLSLVIASKSDMKSYKPEIPFQKVAHYKLVLNTNIVAGDGTIKTIIGWQQNLRREYNDILNQDQYGLYLDLNTVNYDLKYDFPESKGINSTIGVNGMWQQSLNRGNEFLIPDYNLFDAGVYITSRKSWSKTDISGGIRYDHRSLNSESLYLDAKGNPVEDFQPGDLSKFQSFETGFGGFSGSAGITYQLSNLFFTKFNLASGFRAPNISELCANGVHEGSFKYETGNQELRREQSYQGDFTVGINSEHVTGEINIFYNDVGNFIYSQKINSELPDTVTEGLPVYQFTSGNATLYGGEISFDIHPHPLDWLHFENSLSTVEGILKDQPDASHYLPEIPAAKFNSEMKAVFRKKLACFSGVFVKMEYEYVFSKEHVFYENNTETPTPSYYLLNVNTGTDIISKDKETLFSVYIGISNLFDAAYQDHLSRLKYAPENYATGRTGVFNMGRNINFKLIVPLNIKK